jgi:hypothetical protein
MNRLRKIPGKTIASKKIPSNKFNEGKQRPFQWKLNHLREKLKKTSEDEKNLHAQRLTKSTL